MISREKLCKNLSQARTGRVENRSTKKVKVSELDDDNDTDSTADGGSGEDDCQNPWMKSRHIAPKSSSDSPPPPYKPKSAYAMKSKLDEGESVNLNRLAIARKEKLLRLEQEALARAKEKQRLEKEKERIRLQEKEELEMKEAHEMKILLRKERIRAASVQKKRVQQEEEVSQAMQSKISLAEQHYRTYLIVAFGFGPWRRLVEEIRLDWEKAVNFHLDNLLQRSWAAILADARARRAERYRREMRASVAAITYYRQRLMRSAWLGFVKYKRMLRARASAVFGQAMMFSPIRRSFSAWQISLERSRRRIVKQMKLVQPRGDRVVCRHVWRRWLQYVTEARLQREIDSRSDAMWAKVQSWMSHK